MSMTSADDSWRRAMLNAYNLNVSSCTSNVISLPAMPHQPAPRVCDYCRGSLTEQERECPGCGARSSK